MANQHKVPLRLLGSRISESPAMVQTCADQIPSVGPVESLVSNERRPPHSLHTWSRGIRGLVGWGKSGRHGQLREAGIEGSGGSDPERPGRSSRIVRRARRLGDGPEAIPVPAVTPPRRAFGSRSGAEVSAGGWAAPQLFNDFGVLTVDRKAAGFQARMRGAKVPRRGSFGYGNECHTGAATTGLRDTYPECPTSNFILATYALKRKTLIFQARVKPCFGGSRRLKSRSKFTRSKRPRLLMVHAFPGGPTGNSDLNLLSEKPPANGVCRVLGGHFSPTEARAILYARPSIQPSFQVTPRGSWHIEIRLS